PLRVVDALFEGDGDGPVVVGADDALDRVEATRGPGAAADAVALALAGAHLPQQDDVVGADRGAVVPDRLGADLELVAERLLAEELRLLRENVHVVLVLTTRQELPEVRQNPVDGLDGGYRTTLGRPGEVGAGGEVDDP